MQKAKDPQCNEHEKKTEKQKMLSRLCYSTPTTMSNPMGRKKIHYPPPQAFQIFELLELRRRLRALYRRQQDKIVTLAEKGGERIALNRALESS
jgi:hypothetical protein